MRLTLFVNFLNFILCKKKKKIKKNLLTLKTDQKCLNRFNSFTSFQNSQQIEQFDLTKRLTWEDQSIKSLENLTSNNIVAKKVSITKCKLLNKILQLILSLLYNLNLVSINLNEKNINNNFINNTETQSKNCLTQLSTRTVDSISTYDNFETARTISKIDDSLQYFYLNLIKIF